MTEEKNDPFMEKVMLALIAVVGIGLAYNQFGLMKYSQSTGLNILSLLLLLAAILLIVLYIVSKDKKHEIKTESVEEHRAKAERKPFTFFEKTSYSLVAVVALLIFFNQFQISEVSAMLSGGSSGVSTFAKSLSTPLKLGSGKGGVVIGPQINSDGRTTHLVEWPTISETPAPKDASNAIAVVVPTGVPFYAAQGPGAEKIQGASFDDPLTSQKVWASLLGSKRFGTANAIQLTPEEEQRWQKLTSVFTCDFCCGGPNSVTTINRCGCAHSFAWQGMAKFFIKNYPQYTDEQILGEMTKWKALWYPKGMIQDYLVFTGQQSADTLNHGGSVGIRQQFAGQNINAQAAATPVDQLPSMVGGC